MLAMNFLHRFKLQNESEKIFRFSLKTTHQNLLRFQPQNVNLEIDLKNLLRFEPQNKHRKNVRFKPQNIRQKICVDLNLNISVKN